MHRVLRELLRPAESLVPIVPHQETAGGNGDHLAEAIIRSGCVLRLAGVDALPRHLGCLGRRGLDPKGRGHDKGPQKQTAVDDVVLHGVKTNVERLEPMSVHNGPTYMAAVAEATEQTPIRAPALPSVLLRTSHSTDGKAGARMGKKEGWAGNETLSPRRIAESGFTTAP